MLTSMEVSQLRRFQLESGTIFVTQEQGSSLAQKGMIQVTGETDPSNPFAFRAVITEAGSQWLAANPLVQQSGVAGGQFKITSAVPYVPSSRGNRKTKDKPQSPYPFDQMEIGQSFHVPSTTENPEPWKKMTVVVNGANKKFTKKIPGLFQLDEAGNPKLSKKGKQIPATMLERKFVCQKVNKDDPEGVGARIFRVPV